MKKKKVTGYVAYTGKSYLCHDTAADQLYIYLFYVTKRSMTVSFFFFSSRRRHTRSLCDWSSDVCSSDLRELRRAFHIQEDVLRLDVAVQHAVIVEIGRRRVGKECRSRWSPYH